MKKLKRGWDKSTSGQFVQITYTMAQSEAWRSLSGPAVKVYVELHRRFHVKGPKKRGMQPSNNGEISISLEEAKALLHMGKTTAFRALAELEDKGFIVKTKEGHFYGRMAAEYAVTDRPLAGGTQLPTNAWQHWRRPGKKQNAVPTRNVDGPDAEHID